MVDNLRSFVSGPLIEGLLNGTQAIGFHPKLENDGWDFNTYPDRPLLLGQPVPIGHSTFPGGGPGYTLNRAALDRFGKVCYPRYLPNLKDSKEDMIIARCFADPNLGVPPFYTSNTMEEEGRIRYHCESAEFQARLKNIKTTPWKAKRLERSYGLKTLRGVDGASEQSISFHLKDICDRQVISEERCRKESIVSINAETIYRYHAILYDSCESDKEIE